MGSSHVSTVQDKTIPVAVVSQNLAGREAKMGVGNRGKPGTDRYHHAFSHLAAAAPNFNVRQHNRLIHTASAVFAVTVRLNPVRWA